MWALLGNKYLVYGVVILAVLTAVWGYGRYEHHAGYVERDIQAQLDNAKILAASRAKEQAAQTQMEKVNDEAAKQKQVADAAIAAADDSVSRLRHTVAAQARKLNATSATPRANDVDTACWIVLDEAIGRYSAVANDADGYVERLRKGQGWAGVIKAAQ